MEKPLPPFSCTFSPQIPELLQKLNISLAISTYQVGKVILISPKNRDELIQLPRNFAKPMGIAIRTNKMAVAGFDEVTILANAPNLASEYPNNPGTYDAFYLPRSSYYTSPCDLHDLAWGDEGLWAVNTRYSCLSIINDNHSFEPRWKPEFISDIRPDDRCHLNGLAMLDGKPQFVTALGKTNDSSGWRDNKANGGVLIDVETQKVILEGLPMPHSPRIYEGQLLLLLSGTGEIVRVNSEKGTYDIMKSLDGFTRGMDRYEDYLFVGLSKLRTTSKAFQDLPVSKKSVFAGIMVLYLPQMSIVGYIKYESSVDEIYDVRVLPDTVRPGILSTLKPDHKMGVVTPELSFWNVNSDNGGSAKAP